MHFLGSDRINRFLLSTCFLLSFLTLSADRFDQLWKDVDESQAQDLPQTTLKKIDKIISLSREKEHGGHLMKAIMMKYHLRQDISPDSAITFIPVIEKSLKAEKSPVMQSLFHVALGALYNSLPYEEDRQAIHKSVTHYSQSMLKPMLLLKAKATDYVPMVIIREDSRYYNDALLSVVAKYVTGALKGMNDKELATDSLAQDILHREIVCYRHEGMREAEFFALIDSASLFMQKNQKELFLKEMINRFSETDVCAEAYLQLSKLQPDTIAWQTLEKALRLYPACKIKGQIQNSLANLARPELRVTLSHAQMLPSSKGTITVEGRNVTECRLVFYKTRYTAQRLGEMNSLLSEKNVQLGPIAMSIPVSLPLGIPAQWTKSEVSYSFTDPGIYIASLEGLNCDKVYEPLYVTGLHIMSIPLPDKNVRVVVSEAKSGKPVPDAQVVLCSTNKEKTLYKTVKTDANGEVLIPEKDQGQKMMYPVAYGDSYCPGLYLNKNYTPRDVLEKTDVTLSLYTDRAIYRPGQIVHVGGFIYAKQRDEVQVVANRSVKLKLLDANHKEVSTQSLQTDEFGAIKSSFELPAHCLNGTFRIEGDGLGSVQFKVEEYKRPTFTVTIDDVKTSYVVGDTVILSGMVKTYTGFPVANTPVAYSVRRSRAFWYYYRNQYKERLTQDTVFTDNSGRFFIPVVLRINEDPEPCFYQFATDVRVTAENGETENTSYSLYVGNRPATLSTTLPGIICKEKVPSVTITERNMQGRTIPGKVMVRLYKDSKLIRSAEWELGVPVSAKFIQALPSGRYQLVAVPSDRTDSLVVLKHQFSVFSLNDKKVEEQPLLVYATSDTFSEPVSVFVGTSNKDVYLHYDCFAGNKLLESRNITLNDNTMLLKYDYKADYGDGIRCVFTYIRDHHVFSEGIIIRKPDPDKRLQVQWRSFRDKLRPGQQETWVLQILKGKRPVSASVLATLYDASLDKLYKNDWNFELYFSRYVRPYNWTCHHIGMGYLNALEKMKKPFKVQYWQFSGFDESLFSPVAKMEMLMDGALGNKVAGVSFKSTRQLASVALPEKMSETTDHSESKVYNSIAEPSGMVAESDESVNLRTDFSETAFFCSGLTTNEKGEVQLMFQLPQSLTQWNFRALAHDKAMNYISMDTTVVASKDFMVQANMPRFLRVGDEATIVAAVRNTSGQVQKGIVAFDILDPSTMKVIAHEEKGFNVAVQKEENIVFDIHPDAGYPLLICRFIAKGSTFSDGEQYYLPILDDLQEITESYPLTLGRQEKMVNIPDTSVFRKVSSSYRKLIVEYTSNPVWSAVEALPTISRPLSYNASSLSNSFYALTMAAMEAKRHPEILSLAESWRKAGSIDSVYLLLERNQELKQIVLDETPWVASADAERSRLENLAQLFDSITLSYKRLSYLDRLLDLQSRSGGWSWYKGMPDNLWMTISIAENLARLNTIAPQMMPERAVTALSQSMSYIDAEVGRWILDVEKMERKNKTKVKVPHTLLRYLYICALMKQRTHPNVTFLLRRLESSAVNYDMYEKALAVRVLAAYQKKDAARLTLQSLMEHTVYDPEMGRYFDTRRAPSFYESYRIPTQVATMEALESMGTHANLLKEMQQWLLQSKRTQTWNNPQSAADATYYLFSMDKNRLDARPQTPQIFVVYPDGARKEVVGLSDIKESETLGYIYKAVPIERQIPSGVVFSKSDEQTSFAAVYAQYTVPVNEIKNMHSGLSLKCTYEVQRGNSWQMVSSDTQLHKGDVLRICYEISAQRDYDFVSLKAGKAACLEPQKFLSGYSCESGCYREMDDVSVQYFFQQLSKGRHVLYELFNVDRTGTYSTSAPVIQCAYSPEFSARTVSRQFSVK